MNGVDPLQQMDQLDALSESALRGALRLEADERPPRFDAAALAAAAEHRTLLEQAQRAVRGIALIGVSLGIEAAVALVAFNTLADLDLTGPVGVALSLVALVAQRVIVIGQVTTEPSVAVAALAAVLFAIVYERSTGRERMSVRAS
jgi:hypothetical protein